MRGSPQTSIDEQRCVDIPSLCALARRNRPDPRAEMGERRPSVLGFGVGLDVNMGQMPGKRGELICQLRVRAGMTQLDLSQRAGVSLRALRDIERDRSSPRSATLRRLAEALEASAADRERLL